MNFKMKTILMHTWIEAQYVRVHDCEDWSSDISAINSKHHPEYCQIKHFLKYQCGVLCIVIKKKTLMKIINRAIENPCVPCKYGWKAWKKQINSEFQLENNIEVMKCCMFQEDINFFCHYKNSSNSGYNRAKWFHLCEKSCIYINMYAKARPN